MVFMKVVKTSVYGFFLGCCVSCYLLTTTSGLGALIKIAECVVPGHLHIADFRGSITSNLQLHHLFYQSNSMWLSLKELNLNWQPRQLLAGYVVVENARLSGLIIKNQLTEPGPATKPKTSSPPNLAWLQHLKLHQLKIDEVTLLQPEKKPIQLKSLLLTEQRQGQYIKVITSFGVLQGDLHIDLSRDFVWKTKLRFEHVDGASFSDKFTSDINFGIESQGRWLSQDKFAQVKLIELHGTLLNYPVTAQAEINFTPEKVHIPVSNITLADAKFDVNGSIGKVWDLGWNIKIPNFQTLFPEWQGKISTSGTLKGSRKQPLIDAEWQADNVKILNVSVASAVGKIHSEMQSRTANLQIDAKKLMIHDYQIPESHLTAQGKMTEPTSIDTKIKLNLGDANLLEGNVLLTSQQDDLFSTQQKMAGTITAQFNALNELIIIPYVKDLKGALQGRIQLSGYINNPNISLEAKIENGSLKVPGLGMELHDVQIQNKYRTNEALTFSGSLNVGSGSGVIHGDFLAHQPNLPFHVNLSGDNLQILNLPEYKATISPSLELTGAANQYNLKGNIKVTKARITPKDFSNVQTLPSEVTIVDKNEKTATPATPANLSMKLQVILGDDITLHYQSLEASLKGQVLITEKFNSLPVGSGEFYTSNGKYKAFGKILDITQGRLIYTGNLLTNPALDIRAQKQFTTSKFAEDQTQFNSENSLGSVYQGSGQLTVGITVKGTLNSPHLNFFSDPAGLSQTDVMSYLVFGYPRSKIKDMNKLALLNNIASGINPNSGSVDKVTDKVQKVLGLTDLSFDTVESYDAENQTTSMNTTINIGKKFGKRFSVHYRIGVFNPVSVLNLKYQINKRFAIQSEASSTDTGADLLFEYERD